MDSLSELPRIRRMSLSFSSSSPAPSDIFSDSSETNSQPDWTSSAPSSLASSPGLRASGQGSPFFDDLCLDDVGPSPKDISAYAAQIIRNEAYALLSLAARIAPAGVPIVDDLAFDQPVSPQQADSKSSVAFRAVVSALSSLPPHGKIAITGIGKSGIAARKMVATMSSLGVPAVFLHPVEALHGDLGCLCPCSPASPCDALLMISHSGATAELMRLLPIVRPRVKHLVAITRDSESILAKACGLWLDASTGATMDKDDSEKVSDEADAALPAPTSSVMSAMAIGDALALTLSRLKIGWNANGKERRTHFFMNHQGGQLGLKLGREVRVTNQNGHSNAA